jgi:hypothetical protein
MNESPISRLSDFEEFACKLAELNDLALATWLEGFLNNEEFPPLPPSLPLERFEVIQKLCCDPRTLRIRPRIENALVVLLDSFGDPCGKERLLLGLLSLVVVLRPHPGKQALRRMLYSGIVRGSVIGRIQLTNELIVANCKYGVDSRLHEFITCEVPTFPEPEFKTYALACLRGLMYAYDERPFWFIPNLSRFFGDDGYFSKFCYLLRVGILKSGISTFADCYAPVMEALDELARSKVNEFLCRDVFAEDDTCIGNPHYMRMYLRVRATLAQKVDLFFLAKFASPRVALPEETKKHILAEFWRTYPTPRERTSEQLPSFSSPYYIFKPDPRMSGVTEPILWGYQPDGRSVGVQIDERTADLLEDPEAIGER